MFDIHYIKWVNRPSSILGQLQKFGSISPLYQFHGSFIWSYVVVINLFGSMDEGLIGSKLVSFPSLYFFISILLHIQINYKDRRYRGTASHTKHYPKAISIYIALVMMMMMQVLALGKFLLFQPLGNLPFY